MLAFVGYLLQIGMLKSRRFWMVVDPLTYKVHSMLPTEWYLLEKVGSSTDGISPIEINGQEGIHTMLPTVGYLLQIGILTLRRFGMVVYSLTSKVKTAVQAMPASEGYMLQTDMRKPRRYWMVVYPWK
jgi:hypothetical protein